MNTSAQTLSRTHACAIADAFVPPRPWGNRWHYYYAREKLASDPLFPGVLDVLRGSKAPLLDIGCGLALLAHALRQDGQAMGYRGVDIDATKIAHASRAIDRARLADADVATLDLTVGLPAHRGSVAILDVLQYLDAKAQHALLESALTMLAPGSRLVIRAALDDDGRRSHTTRITDWLGHLGGWMQSRPRHYPRADVLRARFAAAGLDARFSPLHGKTPFNHWLIVVERPATPDVPGVS